MYRVLVTGMDGTPMPSYAASAAPEELYDLVHYVLSLNPQPLGPSFRMAPSRFLKPCAVRRPGASG